MLFVMLLLPLSTPFQWNTNFLEHLTPRQWKNGVLILPKRVNHFAWSFRRSGRVAGALLSFQCAMNNLNSVKSSSSMLFNVHSEVSDCEIQVHEVAQGTKKTFSTKFKLSQFEFSADGGSIRTLWFSNSPDVWQSAIRSKTVLCPSRFVPFELPPLSLIGWPRRETETSFQIGTPFPSIPPRA